MSHAATLDPADSARFAQQANGWWDEQGAFKLLHEINPLRVSYIRDQAVRHFARDTHDFTALHGVRVLDIGCGGGLIAEAMARLGAEVTAIDGTERSIQIARQHAELSKLTIDYRHTTTDALVEEKQEYDLVLALEVIEHVADVALFLSHIATLTAARGMTCIATINRTAASLLFAKFAAEYVLRMIPRGTHTWQQFLRPSDIIQPLQAYGLYHRDTCGMTYHPLKRIWQMHPTRLEMNYIVTLTK
jgi:2-polyprenyl-6-hydroxyphenyl methylase/3-demethylubiquinone-9 3-methyltransferase